MKEKGPVKVRKIGTKQTMNFGLKAWNLLPMNGDLGLEPQTNGGGPIPSRSRKIRINIRVNLIRKNIIVVRANFGANRTAKIGQWIKLVRYPSNRPRLPSRNFSLHHQSQNLRNG